MNRIFSIPTPFRVPDGTLVSPFLNAKDSQSDLPFNLLDGFSIAAGVMEPRSVSKIHVMPLVTQVTFVRIGNLTVKMKGPRDDGVYQLDAPAGQAVLTEPGAFYQLINRSDHACEVLYIVSPAYVFDMSPEKVVRYDDSLVLDEDWNKLMAMNWQLPRSFPTREERAEALRRIQKQKEKGS